MGRIFLAGDAAHIHSPFGGQGMNLGMGDVYNLVWKLALVSRRSAPDCLLDTYSPERRSIAQSVLRSTATTTRMTTLKSTLLQRIRNQIVGRALRSSRVQRRVMLEASGLRFHYHGSPLSEFSAGGGLPLRLRLPVPGGLTPGDRAPDVKLPDGTRLFELLRHGRVVVLCFGGLGSRRQSLELHLAAQTEDCALVLVEEAKTSDKGDGLEKGAQVRRLNDPSGELHRRYGVNQRTFWVIRPDGYLGLRTGSHSRLAAYLLHWFGVLLAPEPAGQGVSRER
jgi:hypothetical protein